MSPDLPKTTVKFLIALLKNQAKLWLEEEAAGIAAQTTPLFSQPVYLPPLPYPGTAL